MESSKINLDNDGSKSKFNYKFARYYTILYFTLWQFINDNYINFKFPFYKKYN